MTLTWARIITIAIVGLVLYSMVAAYAGRVALVDEARSACRDAKSDRIDNAAAWTAHTVYITKVTGAASVKEDVKTAAREAVKTYERVSKNLTKRALVDCDAEHPAASLLPARPAP